MRSDFFYGCGVALPEKIIESLLTIASYDSRISDTGLLKPDHREFDIIRIVFDKQKLDERSFSASTLRMKL